jgi:hypothetical protein
LFQILRVTRRKVSGPWFDLVYLEFFNDVGREVFEFDDRVTLPVLGSGDELAEGISGDSDALPGFGGEVQVGRGGGSS